MCPLHLDREKTTNLSQATNKLNNRARRCVQYTWTVRKPQICHKPLINLITDQEDGNTDIHTISNNLPSVNASDNTWTLANNNTWTSKPTQGD